MQSVKVQRGRTVRKRVNHDGNKLLVVSTFFFKIYIKNSENKLMQKRTTEHKLEARISCHSSNNIIKHTFKRRTWSFKMH